MKKKISFEDYYRYLTSVGTVNSNVLNNQGHSYAARLPSGCWRYACICHIPTWWTIINTRVGRYSSRTSKIIWRKTVKVGILIYLLIAQSKPDRLNLSGRVIRISEALPFKNESRWHSHTLGYRLYARSTVLPHKDVVVYLHQKPWTLRLLRQDSR